MARGKPDQAIAEFDRALVQDPDFMEARLQRGIAYAVTRQDERSLADLNGALIQNPDLPAAYYWRSVIHLRREEADRALKDVDRAVALQSKEPANYLVRGFVYLHKKEYDLALKDMTTAIELGFEKDGYNNRALAYEEMGDFTSAIADWTEVIRLAPNDSKAYCKRGILYARTGKVEPAITDLKRGLKDGNQVSKTIMEEARNSLESLLTDKSGRGEEDDD